MARQELLEILIVEDDILHLEMLKSKLIKLGYNNFKTASNYQEAGDYLDAFVPDLIIVDFYLDKNNTGADLVREYLLNKDIPIIFISSHYGTSVLNDIVDVGPMDFLPKNVSEFELEKAIILSLHKRKEIIKSTKLKDFIFVKNVREIRKIAVDDIEYITIDGKYLELYSNAKKYLVRSTLNDFVKKLPDNFVKIHQAYIINLKFLVSINMDDSTALIGNVGIPFSRNYKKDLFNSYYMP